MFPLTEFEAEIFSLSRCCSQHACGRAVVVQELATQWIQSYPCKTESVQETQRSLKNFLRPEGNPRSMSTDNSLEFIKACEELIWNYERSTPRRSETNGIAERAVRRVKEGTSSVLVQSGLQESCWAEAMECYCYLLNELDLPADVQTPCERLLNSPFKGPMIPFGAEVKYYAISSADQSRVHQFGTKVLPGLFIGYALNAGGRKSKFSRERTNLYSHARRTKSCKMDSSYLPLCTKRRATPRKRNHDKHLQNKKKPWIPIHMLKLEKISAAFWEITCIGIIMLLQGRFFRWAIFRDL